MPQLSFDNHIFRFLNIKYTHISQFYLHIEKNLYNKLYYFLYIKYMDYSKEALDRKEKIQKLKKA